MFLKISTEAFSATEIKHQCQFRLLPSIKKNIQISNDFYLNEFTFLASMVEILKRSKMFASSFSFFFVSQKQNTTHPNEIIRTVNMHTKLYIYMYMYVSFKHSIDLLCISTILEDSHLISNS